MKNLLNIFSLFIAMCALSACQSTPPQWSAVGGSRADGVIRLAYEQGEFSSQIPSSQQASQIATSRCKAWGYHAASPFGGKSRKCIATGGVFSQCAIWEISAEYQCTTAADNNRSNSFSRPQSTTETTLTPISND